MIRRMKLAIQSVNPVVLSFKIASSSSLDRLPETPEGTKTWSIEPRILSEVPEFSRSRRGFRLARLDTVRSSNLINWDISVKKVVVYS